MSTVGNVGYKVVPIDRWPGTPTARRKHSKFRANLANTLNLLRKELRALGARDVVLQIAVRHSDIRQDGQLRANARRAEHPGVILTFDGHHGPVSMPCDTYLNEADNLRAIALSLNALRRVDDYGVSKSGEQYRGWQALPSAGGSSAAMTMREASELLAEFSREDADSIRCDEAVAARAIKEAKRATHPNGGGSERD